MYTFISSKSYIHINIYIHTLIHTHTHIYIYIYIIENMVNDDILLLLAGQEVIGVQLMLLLRST